MPNQAHFVLGKITSWWMRGASETHLILILLRYLCLMKPIFKKFIYFNYLFFGCVGSSLLRGLSLVAASGGYSLLP